jgi:hypothetical protein
MTHRRLLRNAPPRFIRPSTHQTHIAAVRERMDRHIMFRTPFKTLALVLRPSLVIYVAFALSLAASVTLLRTNRTLADSFERYRRHFELRPGLQLPPLTGRGHDGRPLRVDFDGQERYTLLLVFSPYCAYCSKNWATWSQLVTRFQEHSVRLVAIDLSGEADAEYIRTHGLADMTLFKAVDYGTRAAYNLYAVPMTMVLGSTGTVEQFRVGQLSAMDIMQFESIVMGRPTVVNEVR